MEEHIDTPRPTMTDEEMIKDYPRLSREYALLHQDYREAIRKPLKTYKNLNMKLKILQKAYHVWHQGMIGFGAGIANSVEETEVVYASRPGEAKMKANEWCDWDLDGKEPHYIDLKCIRAKRFDIVSFNGESVKRFLVPSGSSRVKRDKRKLKTEKLKLKSLDV